MDKTKTRFVKRSKVDRRSPIDRRRLDIGPGYPLEQRRKKGERRSGDECRYSWRRAGRWTSNPTYAGLP